MGELSGAVPVFVVDDHEVVRRGVHTVLEEAGMQVVGEAVTAADARRHVPGSGAQVVIIDLQLPDGSGVELCRDLHDTSDATCLILTSFADDEALEQAVLAGARGYLLKDAHARDLIEAIKVLAAGGTLLDPTVVGRLLDQWREETRIGEGPDRLTAREQEVLELIARGHTNAQIGDELGLAEKTVKNYVSNLLVKLDVPNRTRAALVYAQSGHDHAV